MSDIPPRVRPEDFDALTVAMERCEATAMRVAETRKRLKLEESAEVVHLRATVADLKRRAKLATRYLKSVSSGQFVTAALVVAALRTLDTREPLPLRPLSATASRARRVRSGRE